MATSSIFRVTTPGQNESTVNASNKIEFNPGPVPDLRSRHVTTTVHMVRDISIHPNPNKSLSSIQDGKLGTIEAIIAGYFVESESSLGAVNLFNWMTEEATSTDFKKGRFGIRIDDMPILTLTPSVSIGYILYDVFFDRPEDSQRELGFIAKFYRNGSI